VHRITALLLIDLSKGLPRVTINGGERNRRDKSGEIQHRGDKGPIRRCAITDVPDAITVAIALGGIVDIRTVVDSVFDPIKIVIVSRI